MADFFSTVVISPVEYAEIKAVCLTKVSAKPDATNVNDIVAQYTQENLNSMRIVELPKLGGPSAGTLECEGHEIRYGITYVTDDDGNVLKDEYGQMVVDTDLGLLYGINVGEKIRNIDFNCIVAYSIEKNANTGYNNIALVSMFNNSLSFAKILNFFARYIIEVTKEVITLELDWVTVYKEHENQTNNSSFYMNQAHPQLLQRITKSGQGDVNNDDLTQWKKSYATFIKERDDYMYIRPVDKFDNLHTNAIQTRKDSRLFQYEDTSLRTQYLYFYYNVRAMKQMMKDGFVNEFDNTEDTNEIDKISVDTLRKHIKLGFSETMGPFLYSWASTPKFIYVCTFGSNSNNNIDMYRCRNRCNAEMNADNYNLVVGRYLDRCYFTVDGNLHVCVPQVGDKTQQLEQENVTFRENANASLVSHDFLYVDFNSISEGDLAKAYTDVWEEIRRTGTGEVYLLTKEQFRVFLLSKNDSYKKFVTDGVFKWPDDVPYTPRPNASGDQLNKPVNAVEFFDWGYYNTDANHNSVILNIDQRNVYQYIKRPCDAIAQFKKFFDDLTNECIKWKTDYGQELNKTTYIDQYCQALINKLRSDFPFAEKYNINWWGMNKDSGVKYSVIDFAMRNGNQATQNNTNKYEGYIEKFFTETEQDNIVDIMLNVQQRIKLEKALPLNDSTFNVLCQGVTDRLAVLDSIYNPNTPLESFQKFYLKTGIYADKQIIESETAIRRFYRYSLYRALYNSVVEASAQYQQYVLRQRLIEMEQQGDNNADIIDKYNNMTIAEITNYYTDTILKPLTDTMNGTTWWNVEILEKLEEEYKATFNTKLYIIYQYGSTDQCYYNEEKKEGIDLTQRIDPIPFRYGFPLPTYIYDTATSAKFIIPEHEKEHISGTYHSFEALKEATMSVERIEVDNNAILQQWKNIQSTMTANSLDELKNITVPIQVFTTEEELTNYLKATYMADNTDIIGLAPEPPEVDPDNPDVDQPDVDDPDVDQDPADMIPYDYKQVLVNNKIYSGTSKGSFVLDHDIPANNYVFQIGQTPAEGEEGNVQYVKIKDGTQQEPIFQIVAVTDDYKFQAVADQTYMVQAIVSIKIDETNPDAVLTPKLKLTCGIVEKEETIDFDNMYQVVQMELSGAAGECVVTPTDVNIHDLWVAHANTFTPKSWTETELPDKETVCKIGNEYYTFDGTEWILYTQEMHYEYLEQQGLFYVKNEDKYYKFERNQFVQTQPAYKIERGAIYKVTNTDETINKEEAVWFGGTFTPPRLNQKYTFAFTGVKMVDDRVIVPLQCNKTSPEGSSDYTATIEVVEANKPVTINLSGLQWNDDRGAVVEGQDQKDPNFIRVVKLKYDIGQVEIQAQGNTFTPVANQTYGVIFMIDTVTADPAQVVLKQNGATIHTADVETLEDGTYACYADGINITSADAVTAEFVNCTGSIMQVGYMVAGRDLKEQSINFTPQGNYDKEFPETPILENTIEFTPTEVRTLTVEIKDVYSNDTPTASYVQANGSGTTRTVSIMQNNRALHTNTFDFAAQESYDWAPESNITSNQPISITEPPATTVDSISIHWSYVRKATDTGIKYYRWNGTAYVQYNNITIIPEQRSTRWYFPDIKVYFNIYVEGDKMNVIRDLFKNKLGDTLKVTQFEFSDLGDIVLINNYNNQGQHCWGGVFSRHSTKTEVDGQKVYNYGTVMSEDVGDCFNWDAYNYVQFKKNADGEAVVSEDKIAAIAATYEVSRSHMEVLKDKFGDNIIYSNALTVAWIKVDDEVNYNSRMFIYPKSTKSFPNMTTMPYNDLKINVNNYFVIEADCWFDMTYNRYYKMNTGVNPTHYSKRFLAAARSMVVCATGDHDDENATSGAVTYFRGYEWFDPALVSKYIEKVNIPRKDI